MLSSKKYTTMRFSRYIHRFIYFPKPDEDTRWIVRVNSLCDDYDIDVIMPLSEYGTGTLIAFNNLLKYSHKLLVPASLENYNKARDKGLLAMHMEKYGIPAPKSVVIEHPSNILKKCQGLRLPVLAKPALDTGGGKGIIKIEDQADLEGLIRNTKINYPFVLQEYIEGDDAGCNVLCRNGEILAYTIQKGFLYSDKPYSPQIGLVMEYEQEVLDIAKKLMKSLTWNGVANIDLLYDRTSGNYLVLEINPRYWSTVEGSMIAGVNFPWLYCQVVLGHPFAVPSYQPIRFLNLKGLLLYIKKDKKVLLDKDLLWRHSLLKYAFKDPIPLVYHFLWRTKNIILAKARRSGSKKKDSST